LGSVLLVAEEVLNALVPGGVGGFVASVLIGLGRAGEFAERE